MYLPRNNGRCLLTADLSPRKRRERIRRACSFDFIPFVYDITDVGKQQLKCYSKIENFGECPLKTKKMTTKPVRCKNKFLCRDPPVVPPSTCGWSCDYALLVSGGWSKFNNPIRHLSNVKQMYKHLHEDRLFDEKNIKVFYANNSTIDCKSPFDYLHCVKLSPTGLATTFKRIL